MRSLAAALLVALPGCAAAPALAVTPLGSDTPEVAACAAWFQALDREVEAAGVRDLEYSPVPGFPYLRADPFLAGARDRASHSASAFAALADRLLHNDLESRRHEIANLPAAVVEKWGGMSLDDSRSAALRRSVQCGRLLREVQLARPEQRAALLERASADSALPVAACRRFTRGAGVAIRYAPPPASVARDAVAGWLLRGDADPLGQPLISERELALVAAAYAPSWEAVVASDGDRFGALRWRPAIGRLEIDASQPAVYVGRSYARYREQVLLQIVYTLLFPDSRLVWRVTLAPDGEPLFYDAIAGGCRAVVLTPRAHLRAASPGEPLELPRLREGERPLLAVSAAKHELRPVGVVRGSDSLARYAIHPYDELRSAPTLEGRNRAATGRPALASGEPLERRFVLDLAEPRP